MPGRWTPRQGQFLAFIHGYTNLNGRAPSEGDMERFFRISPTSVHYMILRLEERGLIFRVPGEPRSIQLLVPAEELPRLHGPVPRQFEPVSARTRRTASGSSSGVPPAPAEPAHAAIVPQPSQLTLFDLPAVLPPGEPVEKRPEGRATRPTEPPATGVPPRRRARGPRNPDEPKALGRSRAYAFRVALNWDRKVWRIIEVRGDHLHLAIQDAFGWDDDHLYSFFMSGKRWDPSTEYAAPEAEHGRKAHRVAVCTLDLEPRRRFLYLFDYGDELLHEVWLVGAGPAAAGLQYPRLVKAHGEPPPQYPAFEEGQ